jgi:hypothetical protein
MKHKIKLPIHLLSNGISNGSDLLRGQVGLDVGAHDSELEARVGGAEGGDVAHDAVKCERCDGVEVEAAEIGERGDGGPDFVVYVVAAYVEFFELFGGEEKSVFVFLVEYLKPLLRNQFQGFCYGQGSLQKAK